MSFNKVTTIPGVQSTQTIQGPGSFGVSNNNVLVFGHRRDLEDGETSLPILQPLAGYPRYEYYKTYQIPQNYATNPIALVGYFSACGFDTGWGYSSSGTLLGSALVDDTTLADLERAIVYFTSSAANIHPLVGSAITGTFVSGAVEGAIVSAHTGQFAINGVDYDSYLILESAAFADITAGVAIAFSFTNNALQVPDPTKTEPFIMNLYYAAQGANIPDADSNPNRTLATPNLWFSILPNEASSGIFGPPSEGISLPAPDTAGATSITFAVSDANASLIPLSTLGNSTITQATSLAVGVIKSAEINGTVITVTFSSVTGTFNASNTCTMALDSTVTVGALQSDLFAKLNISLQQIAMPYEITEDEDITTTYASIFDYIAEINEPQFSVNGQAICQIVFARIGISDAMAFLTLPEAIDNYQFEPVFYNYDPIIGELPLTAGNLAASYAMVIGSNVAPLNPQGGIVLHGIPTASNANSYTSTAVGGFGDMIQRDGWNVIAVNRNRQAFVIAPRTGLSTIPGTTVADNEFYPEYLWQTIDYCRLSIIKYLQSIGMGQKRQTPVVMKAIKGSVYMIMNNIAASGMIMPVPATQIIVIQDVENPLGIDVSVSMQVTPGLYYAYVQFNVFSSLVTITTT